jgi:hypothetical protein
MMREYYKYNPIAKQIFEAEAEKASNGKKIVSDFISKIVNNAMDVFKSIIFDMASANDRNPDILRNKLYDISTSKSIPEVVSKLKDYAEDANLSSRVLSDTKNIYMEALDKFCEALDIVDEVSKNKGNDALKEFRETCSSIQRSVDALAKIKLKKIEDLKDTLNESVFMGYSDRIENLKKILYNLISGCDGKNQKMGYGKDWRRIFIDLDQKLEILEKTRNGISERDRKYLEDLEKQIEKSMSEYYNSIIQSTNRILSEIDQDADLAKYYSDATEICSAALDILTRAKSQYLEMMKSLKEEIAENEAEVVKFVFPIKMGDTDENKRFAGTGLISHIQDALADGIPSSTEALKSAGEKGTFGKKTEAVIKAIQKNMGNKNIDGKIDKSLLDSILVSDFISKKHKNQIMDDLKALKKPLKESANFRNAVFIFEEKIVIDKETFAKDLDSYMSDEGKKGESHHVSQKEKDAFDTDDLAKKLRKYYGLKVESDDFKREDGNFRSSYSGPFISAWNQAVTEVGEKEEYQYFFWEGGAYAIDSEKTSLKTPSNWKAWADARQLRVMSEEDCSDFINSYLKDWSTFGMTRTNFRSSAMKSLYKKNADLDLDFPGIYEMVSPILRDSEVPFISFDFLTKKLAKAIKDMSQIGENNPDLGASDMVVLNNLLCMAANTVTFDGERFVSSIKWIYENVLTPNVARRISGDSIISDKSQAEKNGYMLEYEGSTMKVKSTSDIINKDETIDQYKDIDSGLEGWTSLSKMAKTSSSPIKSAFGNSVYFIASRVYPSVKIHVKRMNATDFAQMPQEDRSRCYNVKNS